MYLIFFHLVEPEIAKRETRSVTLYDPCPELPPGFYTFLEAYCPDPDCNCRRVMLSAVGEDLGNKVLAAISYGFDRDDPDAGPFLDPLNPQSSYAPALFEVAQECLLNDPEYCARLERHYTLVKLAAQDPKHPVYTELRMMIDELNDPLSTLTNMVEQMRVERNAPCPCGSGKKYKHCCGRRR